MTGAEVKCIREKLGMTRDNLADFLAVHVTTIFRWEAAGASPCKAEGLARRVLGWLQEVTKEVPPKGQPERLRDRMEIHGAWAGMDSLMLWLHGIRYRKGWRA